MPGAEPSPLPGQEHKGPDFGRPETAKTLTPSGAAEANLKSTWLGHVEKRERAAVEQTYLKSLPIEYRALLLDYYDSLNDAAPGGGGR